MLVFIAFLVSPRRAGWHGYKLGHIVLVINYRSSADALKLGQCRIIAHPATGSPILVAMWPCDARYDVILDDGSAGRWDSPVLHKTTGVLDFDEYRFPDDFGDPGRLIAGFFVRGRTRDGRPVDLIHRNRFRVSGRPHVARYASRRYLRWAAPEFDPPPHDDPDWVIPP